MNIYLEIERLLKYALDKELMQKEDWIYSRNIILNVLDLDDFKVVEIPDEKLENSVEILDNILKWAVDNGVLKHDSPVYRDLLDTKIMNCIMPRPSEVISIFNRKYEEDPKKATEYYYKLSKDSNYIRTDRVAKNMVWKTQTVYGDIDITINLSKPEKDPKAIAAAKNMKSTAYPKCLLCKENEGYAGRVNHPARQTHRVIPITLNDSKWYLQYSPYVYYNEHSIVFKGEHEPMKISKSTFDRLLEFTEKIPHYFVGSNADLPIVGGSILSHDHFQGGNYEFAMAKAPVKETIKYDEYFDVEIGIVNWPMSVVRLKGKDREEISEVADKILNAWRDYSDPSVEIMSYTDDTPHNTITPIARKINQEYELDLVLRNNRTSSEHPMGIFHPHEELHHIKKENIGLIEVMGLAVLPARLKEELEKIAGYLTNKELEIKNDQCMLKHEEWLNELKEKYPDINKNNVNEILKKEVGEKFKTVLEHAGVFKMDTKGQEAFMKFLKSIKACKNK
ncbi:UDP-glucose--hexose-1-phosphate uridylyltransferase [Oceanirhabdus seepicola]|uniref:Galactose-1-phosphate uridylyltransferase n=1 Tax=Oceanirhabdus seepicola TaxID=2828781 RepID=A0A9J6NV55_9CLOT|nr:UDP-glucose--hexose-1-phosphate uridylyltransferase [Oceanirhabdus seepicola]MCM1988367.1 UDP-glucose--hexose-1-phosphate uridylyltransferase [Oceanirhabdus seepicola]